MSVTCSRRAGPNAASGTVVASVGNRRPVRFCSVGRSTSKVAKGSRTSFGCRPLISDARSAARQGAPGRCRRRSRRSRRSAGRIRRTPTPRSGCRSARSVPRTDKIRPLVVEQIEVGEPGDEVAVESEPAAQIVVVVVGHGQEFEAGGAGAAGERQHIRACEGDVLGQGVVVECLGRDVERDAHRAVGGPEYLTAHQATRTGHLGGGVGVEPEDAAQEQHRILGGLPGLGEVDVVDPGHRAVGAGTSVAELAGPGGFARGRVIDPEQLGAVGSDGRTEILFVPEGAAVGGPISSAARADVAAACGTCRPMAATCGR